MGIAVGFPQMRQPDKRPEIPVFDQTPDAPPIPKRKRRKPPPSNDRNIILLLSIILFAFSSLMIFGDLANTPLKQVMCIFPAAFSFGGFYTLFSGTASISLGKWFRASGAIAVALFILLLFLNATKIINIDLGKAFETSMIAKFEQSA